MKQDTKTRFSLSIAPELADELDGLVVRCGYPSRSQAVSEIIREHLTASQAESPKTRIVGTVTLVYDHHKRNIQALLTDIQHEHQHEGLILATLHVHLDHSNCMEVLAVRGPASAVKQVADRLIAAKGVKHGKLTVTTTGQEFGS